MEHNTRIELPYCQAAEIVRSLLVAVQAAAQKADDMYAWNDSTKSKFAAEYKEKKELVSIMLHVAKSADYMSYAILEKAQEEARYESNQAKNTTNE